MLPAIPVDLSYYRLTNINNRQRSEQYKLLKLHFTVEFKHTH